MKKRLALFALLAALLVVLSSCGPGGKSITVGAKTFTEQLVIAKMTTFILEDNGYNVEEIQNLGSSAMRQAIETRQVDMSWEYVGTALVTYLDQEPIADKDEAMQKVQELDKKNGIAWTNLTDANNTYALVMERDKADELGIETLSDLAAYEKENPTTFDSGWRRNSETVEMECPG